MTVSREEIARQIVTDWIGSFDPPPQIDFQQSEVLQAIIVAALRAAAELDHRTSGEPDAWEWRACIGGRWGAWLYLDQPMERFTERNAFNLENGTYELRPLYAYPLPNRRTSEERPCNGCSSLCETCEPLASSLPDHQSAASHSQERLIGGSAFCGHGVMAAICDQCNPNRVALAISRLRAAVNGDDFEWEINGGSPFDDAKILLAEYDRLASQAGSEASSGAEIAVGIEANALLGDESGSVLGLWKQAQQLSERQKWYLAETLANEIGQTLTEDSDDSAAPEQAAQGDVAETAADRGTP